MEETAPAPTMSVTEKVTRVGQYLRTLVDENEVAAQMGWTREELDTFRADYSDFLAIDAEAAANEPTPAPTDAQLLEPPAAVGLSDGAPTDTEIAQAIERADRRLESGLLAIGLSQREADEARALQQFNQGHFKESMDVASASLLKTDIKVMVQQREIEERLAFVRERIAECGPIVDPVRDSWVAEEKMLLVLYLELGQLVVNIKETFYRGAAHLALIKMRLSHNGPGGTPGRSSKPGFRPNNRPLDV